MIDFDLQLLNERTRYFKFIVGLISYNYCTLLQVMDNYGYTIDVHLHMAIILLPILLSCLVRNLKYLAPLSAVANVFMVVGIVITIYFSSQELPPISERHYVANLSQIPLFFGTALFAFEGIGLVSHYFKAVSLFWDSSTHYYCWFAS